VELLALRVASCTDVSRSTTGIPSPAPTASFETERTSKPRGRELLNIMVVVKSDSSYHFGGSTRRRGQRRSAANCSIYRHPAASGGFREPSKLTTQMPLSGSCFAWRRIGLFFAAHARLGVLEKKCWRRPSIPAPCVATSTQTTDHNAYSASERAASRLDGDEFGSQRCTGAIYSAKHHASLGNEDPGSTSAANVGNLGPANQK